MYQDYKHLDKGKGRKAMHSVRMLVLFVGLTLIAIFLVAKVLSK